MKEFLYLISLLFSEPKDVEKVTLVGMNHFPCRGKYLNWCGRLIYRNEEYKQRKKEWISKDYKALKERATNQLAHAKHYKSWLEYYIYNLW